VVVKSLSHELKGQAVFVAGGLFNLGPLILEPDFDLGLVQVEFLGQRLSPLLRYVPVSLELGFQSLQLLGRERCPGALVLFAVLLLFQFPCPWAWRGNNNGNKIFILRLDKGHKCSSKLQFTSTERLTAWWVMMALNYLLSVLKCRSTNCLGLDMCCTLHSACLKASPQSKKTT